MATPKQDPKTIITIIVETWDGNFSHKRKCLVQVSMTEEFIEKFDVESIDDKRWLAKRITDVILK